MEGRMNCESSGLWRSIKNGDFEEEDVWDVVLKEPTNSSFDYRSSSSKSQSFLPELHFSSAARMIPRATHGRGGGGGENQTARQSAPLPIPHWFKTRGKNSRKSLKLEDDSSDGGDDRVANDDPDSDYDDDEDGDNEEYGSRLPPHEMIAKRVARSQISSFSVLEGVGRKLKGRDLSKVRNAVLTKTGFLESL